MDQIKRLEGEELRETYKNILSFELLKDNIQPPLEIKNDTVDLTRYNRPIIASDTVKNAINDGHLDINEAADNFMLQVKQNPDFHCRGWVERINQEQGAEISRSIADYKETGRRPEIELAHASNAASRERSSPIWNAIDHVLHSLGITCFDKSETPVSDLPRNGKTASAGRQL